jgi:hypothetical protein
MDLALQRSEGTEQHRGLNMQCVLCAMIACVWNLMEVLVAATTTVC